MTRKLILGTSGATLLRGRRATLKMHPAEGAARLAAQAAYMRQLGAPLAPVRAVRVGSYATPTLRPLTGSVSGRLSLARASLARLWCQPATLPPWWAAAHWRYVAELCTLHRLPWVQSSLQDLFFNMLSNPGPVCATHGDATLDNMMLDSEAYPVWIDPLPPSDKVPPFLCVDLGKLLQSARGYEHVKYGDRWPAPTHTDTVEVLDAYPVHVRINAWYWYRVHLLRLLRYASPRISQHVTKELNALCL